jgi:hypothetical protein
MVGLERANPCHFVPAIGAICPHVFLRIRNDDPDYSSGFENTTALGQEIWRFLGVVNVFEKMLSEDELRRIVGKWEIPPTVVHTVHFGYLAKIHILPSRLSAGATADIQQEVSPVPVLAPDPPGPVGKPSDRGAKLGHERMICVAWNGRKRSHRQPLNARLSGYALTVIRIHFRGRNILVSHSAIL